jgi:hypothetical protein
VVPHAGASGLNSCVDAEFATEAIAEFAIEAIAEFATEAIDE